MKQVIVMRSDLKNTEGHKVRTGKLIAQGAHASVGAVLNAYHTEREKLFEWLAGSFTKITLRVDNEEDLLNVYQQAKDAGLITCLITDNGTTEFGGVPTNTCIAIGPDTSENIDPITGHLKTM